MASRLWDTLLRFHSEVVMPDVDNAILRTLGRYHRDVVQPDLHKTLLRFNRKLVKLEIQEMGATLRKEIAAAQRLNLKHFDAIDARFDRLEDEYHSLTAAAKRIEEQHQDEN